MPHDALPFLAALDLRLDPPNGLRCELAGEHEQHSVERLARRGSCQKMTGMIRHGHAPRSRTERSARAFFVGASMVAAIWLAAAATWIAGDTVVPWDSKNQFYAFFRFLADALHSGASPFWNPYHYGGHPSIADPQSLIFAPLFFLWALFDPAPSIRAFDLLVYAHLLIGGIAMAAIGWRARWPLPANILAAALFMLAGAASGRLQHTGIILSYGLFPLAWLTLQLALQRRSLLLALCFAVVAATLALGRNQVALLLCYLLIAAAIAEIVSARNSRCATCANGCRCSPSCCSPARRCWPFRCC